MLSARLLILVGALLVGALTACGGPPSAPSRARTADKNLQPAPPATGSVAGDTAAGRQLFLTRGCVACHQAQGIPEATGSIGPDLTGVASRKTIAATIPNTPENLRAWLRDPRALKSESMMPQLGLSEQETSDLVAFLETLK